MGLEETLTEQGVGLAGEGGVGVDPFFGLSSGKLQQFDICRKAGHAEGGVAGLSRAEEFAGAA